MSENEEEIWEAKEASLIAQRLIPQYHPDLLHQEANILYLFTSKDQKKNGKVILGKAKKLPALMRFLSGTRGNEADFIIIFMANEWTLLDHTQRVALVDHELCHCKWDWIKGAWTIRGHDVEEFSEIIERYGFWKTDVAEMGMVVQQLPLDLVETPATQQVRERKEAETLGTNDKVEAAGRELIRVAEKAGGMTISGGGRSVTIGKRGEQ